MGAPVQGAHNAMSPAEAAAAARQAAHDSDADNIDALIAEMELVPGEVAPVSIDARTGKVEPVAKPRANDYNPEDPFISNPMAKLDLAENPPAANQPTAPTQEQAAPTQETTEEIEEQVEPGKLPQFRLRPTNTLDQQVYGVQKALGVDVATALKIVKEREAEVSPPVSQAVDALAKLPADVPRDVQGIEAKHSALIAESDQTEAAIEAAEAKLDEALEKLDFDTESRVRTELKGLRAKARETRQAVKTLQEAKGHVQSAQAQQSQQFDAAWEASEAASVQKYAAEGISDANSPLRKAMDEAHSLLEASEDPRLQKATYPSILAAEGMKLLRANPGLYGTAAQVSTVTSQPAKPQMPVFTPARGNVPPAPPAPSQLYEVASKAENSSDIAELIRLL